ncbi:MAG: metallophosphoesterase family protein [Parvibaculum sp.]|nr:metallophosphoesterase family protein [Parvibaculum sp.]
MAFLTVLLRTFCCNRSCQGFKLNHGFEEILVFGRLLSLFKSKSEQEPSTPPDMRMYVIGDVHGRDDLLGQLLADIEVDGRTHPDKQKVLVFLGDYVDRGLQSKQVIDRLSGPLLPGFEGVFLKGNHELAMEQFMGDAQFGRTWKYYGGLETLHSYGITELTLSDDPSDFERARLRFVEVLPPSHRHFLDCLSLSAEFGDYFFVHAGVRPGISLAKQVEDDLLWIRDDFLESRSTFGKVIVHGHTPKEAAVFRSNRIGIDTGAYMTGVLTCLVLDGTHRSLIQTGSQAGMRAAV